MAKTKKKASGLDAAAKVLKASGKSMNVKELTETIFKKKLWKSNGKTPHATLSAEMGKEMAKKGKKSRFKKVSPGQFAAA